MKLAHFFLNQDMRCTHDGLAEVLKKKKIKVNDGDFVVFLNRKRNMVKMFCGGKAALLCYKKDNRVIDPGIIPLLPKYCGGDEMNIDAAVREHLLKLMRKKIGHGGGTK